MKALKIFFGVVLALLLLLVLGIGILLWWVDLNDYKKEIEQLAAKQNVILRIEGDLGWSFYPNLGIDSGKLSVKPPMNNLAAPIIFEQLRVGLQILPLFKKEIRTSTVQVSGGQLSLLTAGSDEITHIQQLELTADGFNLQQQPFVMALSLRMSSEKDKKITRTIDLDSEMELTLDLAASVADVSKLELTIDDTHIRGRVKAGFGEKPFYRVVLSGDSIDLDRYTRSSTAPEDGDIDSTAGKTEPLIPAAMVLAFPGDYDISFQKLITNRMVLSDLHLVMNVTPDGLITIKPLKTRLYEGDFNLQGDIDVRSALPKVQLNMSLSPLQLEPALKDFLQVDKTFASGDFSFKADMATQGLTTDDFIKSLAGNFSFASGSITLNKVDLTSSLDANLLQLLQIKLPALMSAENQTVMTQLKGHGTLQQGVAKPAFSALALCTQFNGEGAYDLARSDIDYHLGITFPSTDDNKTCAEINSRLKDIAWPVVCKGSMADDPAKLCRADTGKIQSILAKEVKKEVNQKLENKLDEQINKKFGEGEEADQVKNLIKGLLN